MLSKLNQGRSSLRALIDKIERKDKSSANPLETTTDLVGIRIIAYYLEDVDRIGSLIRREFVVDEENSSIKDELLASDQFGYRSSHFVVQLASQRTALREWASFSGVRAEIQVRTALQHAWAAVSHKLDYKSAEEVPKTLRRQLFRLSALFELADEQFSSLREAREKTEMVYVEGVGHGQLNIPINSSSLSVYADLSPRYRHLEHLVKGAGLKPGGDGSEVSQKRLERDRRDLITALKHFGLDQLADLDRYLDPDESSLKQALSAIAAASGDEVSSIDDWLTQALIVDHQADREFVLEMYTEDAWPAFEAAMQALRE